MERGELFRIIETVTRRDTRAVDSDSYDFFDDFETDYIHEHLPIMQVELWENIIAAARNNQQWAEIHRTAASNWESKALAHCRIILSGFFQQEGFQTEEDYHDPYQNGVGHYALIVFWGDGAKEERLRQLAEAAGSPAT